MTDAAFIFALVLGAATLIGMLWVANTAAFRLSIRERHRKAALANASGGHGFMDDDEEPELDLPAVEARSRIVERA